MKTIFVREGRLRSGWRVFSYVVASRLLLVILLSVVGIALSIFLLGQGVAPDALTNRLFELLTGLPALTVVEALQLGLTLVMVYFWRHFLDKKSFRSLGLRLSPGWWKDMLLGASLVGLIWTFIFVLAFSAKAVTVTAIRIEPAFLMQVVGLGLVFNLLVGLNEEIDARGYVLQNLTQGAGFVPAIMISALYFGAMHLLNPGAGPYSTLGVTLFGILAALGYWATGRLWMPIGMHAAWNFFEGSIFGFLVSGINLDGVIALQVKGPDWVTGGQFGPEGGILTMVPLLIMIGAVYLWGRGRRPDPSREEASGG